MDLFGELFGDHEVEQRLRSAGWRRDDSGMWSDPIGGACWSEANAVRVLDEREKGGDREGS